MSILTLKCHRILENHEDNLLDWFKNKQSQIESKLFEELCIENLKFCCSKETFGPECIQCPKHFDKICSNNGECDVIFLLFKNKIYLKLFK